MRKFKQSVAIVLSVLMLLSVAMVGASAYEAVSVRGTFPGCDWDAGNAMELGQDGLYSFTFADVPVGNYQFKVVADGTWYGDNGANFDVAVSEVGDVTVKFNPETNEISYTGGSAVTGLTVKTMQLMGFAGWEFATAPVMTETETGSGVYTYTAQNVAKGSYTYKFAANGDWAANWGAGADDEALSGDAIWNAQGNLSLYLEEAKDVTFTIDVSKFDYATKEGATYAVTLADATVEETSEASASEDVSSEAVASEDVSSEAVASEDVSSEAVASEDVSSEAVASEDAASEDAASEDASSEATSSEETPVETATVLFTKPADWNAAYCHYWNNDGLTTAWPGIEMEYVGDNDFSQPQYKVDVDVRATSIIFHNNEGTQVEGKYTDGIEGYYVDNGELKFYPDVDIPTDPTEDPATVVPGYYLVGSPAICNGVSWGWDKAWTTGTPKLTQSNDGSFYYYVAENVPSSADFLDDKGQPRYEAKVVYVDETGKVWWHPAGMGNNTYIPVEKDGSTVVFTFVQLTSRPDKDGSDPEAVAATVYGPEEEVPVVDTTVKPSESSASETSGSEVAGSETSGSEIAASETSGSEAAASEAGASEAPKPEAKTTITLKASSKLTATKKTTVKATVKNGKGSTTFKSSNTKVATVTSKGVVKGIKAGTVTITATNNGVKATTKIKVVKAANPMTVKGKTVKVKASAKKTTIKKTKAFTIKNAKGTVSFKKATGNKLITVSKKGVITVKKGLAKGKSYVVKVKVSAKGNGTYLAKTKTAKVTVKVTK